MQDLSEFTEAERILYRALYQIANDWVELSHDKVLWQRNLHMKEAAKALEEFYIFKEKP